jgi:hypothetical protein
MALFVTQHARQQMERRGLTLANVNWCVAGGNYFIQANGTRHYSRTYDNGNSAMHAIIDGNRVVSCWIRGRLDPGV